MKRALSCAVAACCLVISAAIASAQEPVLEYLKYYPAYHSDEEIAPELLARLGKEFPQAEWLTLRKASLLTFHYDRRYSYYDGKLEGPTEALGPRADGFLFTLGLIKNPPASTDRAKNLRRDKAIITKSQTNAEHQYKYGAGGEFPTADGAYFYSVSFNTGLGVDEQTLDRVTTIIKDFAAKEIKAPTPDPPPLKGLTGVWQADFNADASRIIVRLRDDTIGVWDTATGLPAPLENETLTAKGSYVTDPVARQFLFAATGGGCRVFNFGTGKPVSPHLKVNPARSAMSPDAFFSPDCRSVLLREKSGACQVIRVDDGTRLASFSLAPFPNDREIRSTVSFSTDRKSVLLLDGPGALHRYDTGTWKETSRPMPHPSLTGYSVGFSASDYHAFGVTFDSPGENGPEGNLQVWDLSTSAPAGTPIRCKNGVSARFLDGNKRLLVTPGRGETRVLKFPSLDLDFTLPRHDDVEASRAVVTSDQRKILTCGYDSAMGVTEIATGKSTVYRTEGGLVTQVITGPNSNVVWLLCDHSSVPGIGQDTSVTCFDLTAMKPSATLRTKQFLHRVILSPDGRRLMIVEGKSDHEQIRIFDAQTLTELPVTQR